MEEKLNKIEILRKLAHNDNLTDNQKWAVSRAAYELEARSTPDQSGLKELDEEEVAFEIFAAGQGFQYREIAKERWTAKHYQSIGKLNAGVLAKHLCSKFGKNKELREALIATKAALVLCRDEDGCRGLNNFINQAEQALKNTEEIK